LEYANIVPGLTGAETVPYLKKYIGNKAKLRMGVSAKKED